jgi:hypothetical protein
MIHSSKVGNFEEKPNTLLAPEMNLSRQSARIPRKDKISGYVVRELWMILKQKINMVRTCPKNGRKQMNKTSAHRPDDGSNKHLRHVDTFLPDYT